MDSNRPLVIALGDAGSRYEEAVGGKAFKLAQLKTADFAVPQGFCITTWAYTTFVEENGIAPAIYMELGRKSMDEMRWEEIWDAALRIRSLFLTHPLPATLRDEISLALEQLDANKLLVVRSSAPGEDAAETSFAGLHESIIGVMGGAAIEDAVRLVWASLWSDAALLYRRELKLDPAHSRMAVLIQEMAEADQSGVAFGCDPRDGNINRVIVESVPGPCSQLVDGIIDPDRWEIDRQSKQVIVWLQGERGGSNEGRLLMEQDLQAVLTTLFSVEDKFGWAPDMEWCARSGLFTILQVRPVTTGKPDPGDTRNWYLTLRPSDARLREMRRRVANELIPQLEEEGLRLAAEDLELYNNRLLADAVERRLEVVERWKKIYWDEFIPFAHGVRRLATYYNDAVQPEDPYEFVGLLRDQPLIAVQRNKAIMKLTEEIQGNKALQSALKNILQSSAGALAWNSARDSLSLAGDESFERFISGFEDLTDRYLDIVYDQERLSGTTESMLQNILQLAQGAGKSKTAATPVDSSVDLERRLLSAVGGDRYEEAREIMETGRISWKLRDDDNLLVARLESQLLRALEIGVQRLRAAGRLYGKRKVTTRDAASITRGLRDATVPPIDFHSPPMEKSAKGESRGAEERSRQLIGQPASPGVATGRARCIRGRADLGLFQRGEVLVCDAIQPTMTHLVPLASAIIERRGGMLIHGAIIARELGIPCVNGVRGAVEAIANGELVTVDGHLGIVTLGEAEFDLELQTQRAC